MSLLATPALNQPIETSKLVDFLSRIASVRTADGPQPVADQTGRRTGRRNDKYFSTWDDPSVTTITTTTTTSQRPPLAAAKLQKQKKKRRRRKGKQFVKKFKTFEETLVYMYIVVPKLKNSMDRRI